LEQGFEIKSLSTDEARRLLASALSRFLTFASAPFSPIFRQPDLRVSYC
jgi:hypothetical protein